HQACSQGRGKEREAMRVLGSLALLGLVLGPSAAQAAEVSFALPPPDLAAVLPLVSPALDKGPVGSGPMSLPPSPQPVRPLPPARIVVDLTQLPLAPAPPPRFLACNPLGTVFGVAAELVQPARALETFDNILKAGAPPEVIPWARHGRALALYGLGRFPDAREAWTGLLAQSLPRSVAGESQFWLGDTLGRLGDYKNAVARLSTFNA